MSRSFSLFFFSFLSWGCYPARSSGNAFRSTAVLPSEMAWRQGGMNRLAPASQPSAIEQARHLALIAARDGRNSLMAAIRGARGSSLGTLHRWEGGRAD